MSNAPGKQAIICPVLDQEIYYSLGIFNANAFPKHLKKDAQACGDKLALIAHSRAIVQREVLENKKQFINWLHNDKGITEFTPNPRDTIYVVYHSIGFQVGIQSFFIAVKSLLDVYAMIIAKSIDPESTLRGFSKKNKTAGGALLHVLERNAPKTYSNKEALIKILKENIESWINDVVEKRDMIVHIGILDNLTDMHVLLSKKSTEINDSDIVSPTILNGVEHDYMDLAEYCNLIWKNINNLLRDTLMLLPGIEMSLIEFS